MKGLRRLRKAAGLTQEELSNRLGVVRATVSAWECGTNTPSINMAFRVAEILHCTVEALYREAPIELTPEEEELE